MEKHHVSDSSIIFPEGDTLYFDEYNNNNKKKPTTAKISVAEKSILFKGSCNRRVAKIYFLCNTNLDTRNRTEEKKEKKKGRRVGKKERREEGKGRKEKNVLHFSPNYYQIIFVCFQIIGFMS